MAAKNKDNFVEASVITSAPKVGRPKKTDKLRNPAYVEPQIAPESPTEPATAPKLPKAIRVAKTAKPAPTKQETVPTIKWTPELPYVALIDETKEVVGYGKEDNRPGVASIWVVYTLAGKTLGYALSRDKVAHQFSKKTGRSVSPNDIA